MTSLLNRGTFAKDPTADALQAGADKLNANLLFTHTDAATVNAGYFSSNSQTGVSLGKTAVQIVQAAIDYAVANGHTAVRIPKKAFDGTVLLPYDASQVTFNSTVHMLREGGPGTDVWDPIAYGAAGNNTGDDWDELVACRDAAAALAISQAGTGGGIIQLGPYNYRYSKPLFGTKQGTRIRGTGRGIAGDSRLSPSFAFGPAVMSTDPINLTVPLTTGITGAGGNALLCAQGAGGWWFNARDAGTIDAMNGASAFSVRGYFKATTLHASDLIVSCCATKDDKGTALALFGFYCRIGGAASSLTFSCNIGGTQKTVDTGNGTVITGTAYYYEASYDGATLRLYLGVPGSSGNAPLATAAASGNLVIAAYEECTYGYGFFAGPGENNPQNASLVGSLDAQEIANVARTTSGSATFPNGKFTADANSKMVVNWDEALGSCAKATSSAGTGWLYRRDRTQSVGVTDNFELSDCTVYGNNTVMGLILDQNNHRPTVRNVYFQQVRSAILATQRDSYFGEYSHNWFQGPTGGVQGRYGLYIGSSDEGIGEIRNSQWDSNFTYPVMCFAGMQFTKCFLTTSTFTRAIAVFSSAGNTANSELTNCNMSTESGITGGVFQGLIIASGTGTGRTTDLLITGGIYETNGVPIILNRSANVYFVKAVLDWFTGAPSSWSSSLALGTWAGSGTHFDRCTQPNTTIAFSDVAGAAAVGYIGKLSAVAFSATPTFDASLRDSFEITITGNVTSSTLSNVTPGQRLTWRIVQSGGPFTFAWPTNVKGGGTVGAGSNVQEFEVGLDNNAYALAAMVTGL